MWCSTQGIYGARSELAAAFELELDQVRVLCEYMGGGFGSKIGCGDTGVIWRPSSRAAPGGRCGWCSPAREENLSAGFRTPADRAHRRSAPTRTARCRRSRPSGDGHWGRPDGSFPVLEPAKAVYQCDNVHTMVLPMRQNLGPSAAFRAPGVMEGTWALEQTRSTSWPKRSASTRSSCAAETMPIETRAAGGLLVQASVGVLRPRRASCRGGATATSFAVDGRIRRGMGCASQYWWGGGGPPGLRRGSRRPHRPAGADRAACRISAPARSPPARSSWPSGWASRSSRSRCRPATRALAGHGPMSGWVDDARVDRPGGALGRPPRPHPAARAGRRPVRDLGGRPDARGRRGALDRRHSAHGRSPRSPPSSATPG